MAKPFPRLLGAVTFSLVLVLPLGVPVTAAAATLPPSALLVAPQPKWKELSAEQKRVLAPLAKEWDSMENYRRKKWLGIVRTYMQLSPDEQQRVQERMRVWAKLSPEQRMEVREQYRQFKHLPSDQKAEVRRQWENYATLPPEDKIRFKEKASNLQPIPFNKILSNIKTDPVVAPPAIAPVSSGNGSPASSN